MPNGSNQVAKNDVEDYPPQIYETQPLAFRWRQTNDPAESGEVNSFFTKIGDTVIFSLGGTTQARAPQSVTIANLAGLVTNSVVLPSSLHPAEEVRIPFSLTVDAVTTTGVCKIGPTGQILLQNEDANSDFNIGEVITFDKISGCYDVRSNVI